MAEAALPFSAPDRPASAARRKDSLRGPCHKKAGHLCPAGFDLIVLCANPSPLYRIIQGPHTDRNPYENAKHGVMHALRWRIIIPGIAETVSETIPGSRTRTSVNQPIIRSANHTSPDTWQRTVSRRSLRSWRARPSCSTQGACHNRPAPHSGSNASSRGHCSWQR